MSDESPTETLKRVDPFWAWVRHNVTVQVAGTALASMALAVYGWASLKHDVGQLQKDIAALAGKAPPEDHAVELGQLRQQVADLKEQVERHEERWARVDEAADIRVTRKTHH